MSVSDLDVQFDGVLFAMRSTDLRSSSCRR